MMDDWETFADDIFRIQRKSILPLSVRILVVMLSTLISPAFFLLKKFNSEATGLEKNKFRIGGKWEDVMMTVPGADFLATWLSNYYLDRIGRNIKQNGDIPKHIGIIMDGNRRFAEDLEARRETGHALGAEKLWSVLDWAKEFGIKYGTVYAFSNQNMERSEKEVNELMDLLERKFREIADDPETHEDEIRVRIIGDKSGLPARVREAMEEAEDKTEGYDGFVFNVAVNYGGREEIVNATRQISEKVSSGEIDLEKIDEELVDEHLYMSDIPDPDLIIRTSGEERLSGFLLWRSAYSELHFCDSNWPAMTKLDFLQALYDYQSRDRRFGR